MWIDLISMVLELSLKLINVAAVGLNTLFSECTNCSFYNGSFTLREMDSDSDPIPVVCN